MSANLQNAAATGIDWEEVNRLIIRLARTARRFAVGDPEDFIQEVAGRVRVKLVNTLPGVEGLRSLEAYVRVVITNAAKDLRRDLLLRYLRVRSLDEMVDSDGFEPAATHLSPEQAALRGEWCAARWEALEQLGEAYPRGLRVLLMRYVAGRTAAEAAALEGTRPEYVDHIVLRSRRWLRADRVVAGAAASATESETQAPRPRAGCGRTLADQFRGPQGV